MIPHYIRTAARGATCYDCSCRRLSDAAMDTWDWSCDRWTGTAHARKHEKRLTFGAWNAL